MIPLKLDFSKCLLKKSCDLSLKRTKLSVRVHACIEKLYNSKGRDLRRALFSLKQIFQDDEELVHEFVKRDGLNCLVKVFQVDIDLPLNELIWPHNHLGWIWSRSELSKLYSSSTWSNNDLCWWYERSCRTHRNTSMALFFAFFKGWSIVRTRPCSLLTIL